jgi:raffinose/stachyose/melibiose transport system permease protein
MRKVKGSLFSVLKYLSLLAGVFVAVLPLLVILFSSFKTADEYRSTGPLTPPDSWINFDNFIRAFVDGNMLTGFTNTGIILVISLIGTTLTGSMVAFVLNRFKFRGRGILLAAFLFAVLIPGVTTQVATFQIINDLGLFNTRWSAIILYMGTDIVAVYIFMQFLENISVSLDESALLDGASYFTIFSKIILPLLKPAIVTVIIVKGVNVYNDFYTPFLYMPKKELSVVSTALFKFQGPMGTSWEVISAGIMIVIIPTLIIFLLLQKHIYNGITQGSVK